LSIIDLEKITSLILIRFCIEVDLQNQALKNNQTAGSSLTASNGSRVQKLEKYLVAAYMNKCAS